MGLNRLTDRIYYLEHEPETDRPMLAYIRGINGLWPLMRDIRLLMWQILQGHENRAFEKSQILL